MGQESAARARASTQQARCAVFAGTAPPPWRTQAPIFRRKRPRASRSLSSCGCACESWPGVPCQSSPPWPRAARDAALFGNMVSENLLGTRFTHGGAPAEQPLRWRLDTSSSLSAQLRQSLVIRNSSLWYDECVSTPPPRPTLCATRRIARNRAKLLALGVPAAVQALQQAAAPPHPHKCVRLMPPVFCTMRAPGLR